MDETELTVDEHGDNTTVTTDDEKAEGGPSRATELKNRFLSVAKPTLVMSIVFTVTAFVVGTIVPIIPGAGLLGVAAAGLVAGLTGRANYASAALAGGIAGLASMALNLVVLSFLGGGGGLPLLGIVAVLGIVAGVGGYHFGRDFYDGVTDPV